MDSAESQTTDLQKLADVAGAILMYEPRHDPTVSTEVNNADFHAQMSLASLGWGSIGPNPYRWLGKIISRNRFVTAYNRLNPQDPLLPEHAIPVAHAVIALANNEMNQLYPH